MFCANSAEEAVLTSIPVRHLWTADYPQGVREPLGRGNSGVTMRHERANQSSLSDIGGVAREKH